MKARKPGLEVDAFILGGPEHAVKSPDWFYEACSRMTVLLSRNANNRIQAMLPGGEIAHEGDYLINSPGGITTLTPAQFAEQYEVIQ